MLNDFGAADLGDFQMILISSVATVIFAAASWEFLTLIDIVQTTHCPTSTPPCWAASASATGLT